MLRPIQRPTLLLTLLLFTTALSTTPSPTPQPECTWKPDPGTCRGFFRRYFFNPVTRACELFVHGGCDGIVPFRTSQQCEAAHCNLLPKSRLAVQLKEAVSDPLQRIVMMEAYTVVS